MKNGLFNLFTAVCLVLAIATANLRGHSQRPPDRLHIQTVSFSPPTISIRQFEIWSAEGVLFFSLHTITIFPISPQEMEIDRALLDAANSNGIFAPSSTPIAKYLSNPAMQSDTAVKSRGIVPEPRSFDSIETSTSHIMRENSLQFSEPSWALLAIFLLFPAYWLTRRTQISRPADVV